ncbi:MAG TPA: DUF4956 domain-containing protein [Vicinamibacterales bacterium]|nr:DUF4956 domain-containing protein [Vicinamibacterales bacterium]
MVLALLGLAGLALYLAPGLQAAAVAAVTAPRPSANPFAMLPSAPMLDGLKLLLAALIGAGIAAVQRQTRKDFPLSRSMAQTYVLLCIAGALTMTMIGESLPRAFAVGGAASIVRFRTPVEDPRDGSALFLLMGLGMACGVGAFSVAIIGTLFLAGCLAALGRQPGAELPRSMRVAVTADGSAYPAAYIAQVFLDHRISVEPIEISHGEQTVIRYKAVLNGNRALEAVSQQLLDGGASGIKSVSWEAPKRWL